MIHNILAIGGTDPSGGAGIAADIKSFSAMKSYGMSVVTAIVAQNTCGVTAFQTVDPDLIAQQIDVVFQDIRVDSVKIGMIANQTIAKIVADKLSHYKPPYIILDPVMVAKSGDILLDEDAINSLREELLPIADIVTPNLWEADILLGEKNHWTLEKMQEKIVPLCALTKGAIMLKGGQLQSESCCDIYRHNEQTEILFAPRIDVKNTHGTGCTLSAAIAALAPSMTLLEAAKQAKDYLTQALRHSTQLSIGKGKGPVHHFWQNWH